MANNQNLKPAWPKGVSGNPAGHAKGIPNIKTRWARILEIVETKENPVTKKQEKFSVIEQIDMRLFAAALKGNIYAIDKIYDRLEGRAPQGEDTPEQLNVKFEVVNYVPRPKK